MTAEEVDEVARAAELHDVGKVGIPDAILDKPGPLDPHEWEFMRQHTILGERILNAAAALRPVARLVRSSHERWDGAGYPDGLSGDGDPARLTHRRRLRRLRGHDRRPQPTAAPSRPRKPPTSSAQAPARSSTPRS